MAPVLVVYFSAAVWVFDLFAITNYTPLDTSDGCGFLVNLIVAVPKECVDHTMTYWLETYFIGVVVYVAISVCFCCCCEDN